MTFDQLAQAISDQIAVLNQSRVWLLAVRDLQAAGIIDNKAATAMLAQMQGIILKAATAVNVIDVTAADVQVAPVVGP